MVTSAQCFKKYGDPYKESSMILWIVPKDLQVGKIPKRIYCNKDMVAPLSHAFCNIIDRGYINELVTWNGCFIIRKKRGGSSMSLHSWGIAIDVNAATNQMGQKPTLSAGFVKCFTDAGFDWGGYWKGASIDGMHFQLAKI
jgi:hypothetical protein